MLKPKGLIFVGPWALWKGSFPLTFYWTESNCYYAGFETREKAEAWARREGIIPQDAGGDPQGAL